MAAFTDLLYVWVCGVALDLVEERFVEVVFVVDIVLLVDEVPLPVEKDSLVVVVSFFVVLTFCVECNLVDVLFEFSTIVLDLSLLISEELVVSVVPSVTDGVDDVPPSASGC